MTDEPTNTPDTEGEKADKPAEAPKEPVSKLEEAKEVLAKTEKVRDELKAENDRADKAKADALLSGDAGGHVEPKVVDPAQKEADEIVNAFEINDK